mmetsp:Transcript_23308/g.40453  ORF Transcript_23308/g.40453 Transcript_23308/m.40453 type:complete len:205 (-) Transcript_23308:6678-7292(-)
MPCDQKVSTEASRRCSDDFRADRVVNSCQRRITRSSARWVLTVSRSNIASCNSREDFADAPWVSCVKRSIFFCKKKPGTSIRIPPRISTQTTGPAMDATSKRKTKINGMSAIVPMVEAVKNSRTDPNSRIAEKVMEGECPRKSLRMPITRLIRTDSTDSSTCRPAPSIRRARAIFRKASINSARQAPMASTHRVASDWCGITRS